MKKTPIRPSRALASAATLLVVLQTLSASAQDQPDKPEDKPAEPPATTEPTPAPGAPAATEPPAPATETQGGAEASAGVDATLGGETQATAETDREAEAPSAPASEDPDEADANGEPESVEANSAYGLGVMRLPDSAYPELQVRGIKGGSLWFTMHGQQWPYMPMRGNTPGVMLGVSGFAWVDPSYAQMKTTEENNADRTTWRTQGRFGVRFTPTYTQADWFVQGQAELIANSNQNTTRTTDPDTDDLWVRAGQWNKWDVQIGRYEGWELYHFGMGLDQNTFERMGAYLGPEGAPQIYGVTYGYYRDDIGNIAGHYYPTDYLRFELLGKFGNLSDRNTIGARPVGVLDLGYVKVKLAGEYFKETEQDSDQPRERELRGVGAAVQGVFVPYVEAGINGAYGLTDAIDNEGLIDPEGTFTSYSYGGFANFGGLVENLIVGGGANYTWKDNVQKEPPNSPNAGQVGEFDHLQVFGAVQYALFGQFYLKLVGAYAKARLAPTLTQAPPYDSTMTGLRFRASYYF